MSQVKKFYNKYYSGENKFKASNLMDRLYLLLRRFDTNRYQTAAELLRPLRGKLLDIGCGDGLFLNLLDDRFEKYGIDISDIRLDNNKNTNINTSCFDLNDRLPYDDNTFDIVTCLSVLEHLFDVHFQLGEYRRVLKPGGTLLLEVPNVAFFPNRLRLLFGRAPITGDWSMAWDDNHLHFFARKELSKLLQEFGFTVGKITGSGIGARFRNWWPGLLCGNLFYQCRKL